VLVVSHSGVPSGRLDGSVVSTSSPGLMHSCKEQLWTKEEDEKHHRSLSLGAPEVTAMTGSSERVRCGEAAVACVLS
jgi:hypothetical protein